MRAVAEIGNHSIDLGHAKEVERYARAVERAWNARGQEVVVHGSGLARESVSAHRCISADYDMKKHSQGQEKLPGIPSLIERLLRTPAHSAGNASMARFWFRIADIDRQPTFVVDGRAIAIDQLDVAVFTERQTGSRDGRTRDAGGKQDPIMVSMAADLTRFMTSHPQQGSYASFDQSYRLLALLQAVDFRRTMDPVHLPYIALRQPELDQRPMPAELPGLVNYELLRSQAQRGTVTTTTVRFPLVMGGGDMSMKVTAQSFSRSRRPLRKLAEAIKRDRPQGGWPAYWIYR